MKTIALVLLAVLCLLPGRLSAQTFSWNSGFSSGNAITRCEVYLKRGEFPTARTIYWFNGASWIAINVGPGQSDGRMSGFNPVEAYAGYAVHSSASYTGLTVTGQSITVQVPSNMRTIQFAMTAEARTQGPYINVDCWLGAYSGVVTRVAAGGGSSNFAYAAPRIDIHYNQVEGQDTLTTTGGNPPDSDGDGIPDETDPDDDNDGISDGNDDFPKDPTENNDNDGDGIGDNADPDDDNDGKPDGEDAFPWDPGQWKPDTDGDGTPDDEDAFPNNPGEDKDSDGDGIGDNADPDDNTPPGGGGGDDDDPPGGGGGDDDDPPGGGGGGGDDEEEGEPVTGSFSEVPSLQEMAEGLASEVTDAFGEVAGAVTDEVGSWKVWDINMLNPGIAEWSMTINFGGALGTYTYSPFPDYLALLRKAILVCLGFCFLAGTIRMLSWR